MTVDTLVIDPPRRLAYGLLALAVVLAAAGVLADPAGQLLALPAAGVALLVALQELRAGAVLVADRCRVVARQGWRRVDVTWSDVERLRVVKDRRTELLEIDLGHTTVLLSRARLGRYPADVLADLRALRPDPHGSVSR